MCCVVFVLWQMRSKKIRPRKHAFSAKEAVDYALKNAVQVKNALLDIELQRQTNKEITAAALPQISGTVGLTIITCLFQPVLFQRNLPEVRRALIFP